MKVTAIGGAATSTTLAEIDATASRPTVDRVLDAVAQRAGVSPSSLRAELRVGATLAEVAAATGLPTSDVTAAIVEALHARGHRPDDAKFLADRLVHHRSGAHVLPDNAGAGTSASPSVGRRRARAVPAESRPPLNLSAVSVINGSRGR